MIITGKTLAKMGIILIPVLSGLITLAASAAEPVAPAGMKCAKAQSTEIKADGTIVVKTRLVCVK
jgi:hypothetical protein